jgi:hypothetical protein
MIQVTTLHYQTVTEFLLNNVVTIISMNDVLNVVIYCLSLSAVFTQGSPFPPTRVGCLTDKMDIESSLDRSHKAHKGMHHYQKIN